MSVLRREGSESRASDVWKESQASKDARDQQDSGGPGKATESTTELKSPLKDRGVKAEIAAEVLLMRGRVLPSLPARKCFKLFVGGYAEDFSMERARLHTNVFPRLHALCMESGIDFDVVDMMHCVNDVIPPEPNFAQVCLQEATDCLEQATVGLRYLAMVGNKVGLVPFPAKLSKHAYTDILNILPEEDKEVLKLWYVPDEGSYPLHYKLQSPLCAAEEIARGADIEDLGPEDRLRAFRNYRAVEVSLRRSFLQASQLLHVAEYNKSLLQSEMELFLEGKHGGQGCVMSLRYIRGINNKDGRAKIYKDVQKDEVDSSWTAYMDWIHQNRAQQLLGSGKQIVRSTINWTPFGVTDFNEQHKVKQKERRRRKRTGRSRGAGPGPGPGAEAGQGQEQGQEQRQMQEQGQEQEQGQGQGQGHEGDVVARIRSIFF
eukprot:764118-Hanusia_phi.AAC.3